MASCRWRKIALIITLASICVVTRNVNAAACSVALGSGAVTMIPAQPIEQMLTRLYVTVDPKCARDVEGTVSYTANAASLGAKPFSYKSMGEPEEVWIAWTPTPAGTVAIRIDVAGSDPGELDTATFTMSVPVDRDTDDDGTGDAIDTDDDDDGASDANDDAPQNPNIQTDTDRDGTDNTVDSDDDNDGVFDFEEEKQGSDPTARDTDKDGVADKEDAFPKDKNRSAVEEVIVDDASAVTPEPLPVVTSDHVTSVPGTSAATVFANDIVTSTADAPNPRVLADADPALQAIGRSSPAHRISWLWILAIGLFAMGFWFLLKDKKRRRV